MDTNQRRCSYPGSANYRSRNPFQNPPQNEKLVGGLYGTYSRRINIQYRLVYQVLTKEHVVKFLRMWTHYE
jgi:Txe/YoeB family toxin of toxin-antitoxin system